MSYALLSCLQNSFLVRLYFFTVYSKSSVDHAFSSWSLVVVPCLSILGFWVLHSVNSFLKHPTQFNSREGSSVPDLVCILSSCAERVDTSRPGSRWHSGLSLTPSCTLLTFRVLFESYWKWEKEHSADYLPNVSHALKMFLFNHLEHLKSVHSDLHYHSVPENIR